MRECMHAVHAKKLEHIELSLIMQFVRYLLQSTFLLIRCDSAKYIEE